eukprot:10057076-Alexandrium_andersonii.AAC.1
MRTLTRRAAPRARSLAGSASAWTSRSASTPLQRVSHWMSCPGPGSPLASSPPSGRCGSGTAG